MLNFASFVFGILLLIAGTIGCFMMAGNSPAVFLFLVPALGMVLIPVGCSIIAFGLRGPVVMLRSLAGFWRAAGADNGEDVRMVSVWIGYVYGAGSFLFFASLLTIVGNLPWDVGSRATPGFRGSIEGVIVTIIYTVVLAELVLRPLKHRLGAAGNPASR